MRVQDFFQFFEKARRTSELNLNSLLRVEAHLTESSLAFPLGIVAGGRDDLYVSDAFHKAFLEVSIPPLALSSSAAFLFPSCFILLFIH